MKYLLIICILLFTACNHENQKTKDSNGFKEMQPPPLPNYYLTSKETQRHVVFKFEAKRDSALFDEHVEPANLSKDEIVVIERLIAGEIIKYNKKAYRPVKQPEKYFKQIIPVINLKGEKEVWVDCFCGVTPDWKKHREHVNDGGNCFIHLKINLTKRTVLKFYTNGLA